MNKILKEYILVVIGSTVMAIGTGVFLLPNKLSTGGFSGIATIFYYHFKIPMGTSIILMNLPFFIIAYFKLGKKFLIKTIFGTAFYSKMLDLMVFIQPFTRDKFLSSIYGGVLIRYRTRSYF
ncbi:MAG: YitT family protein [Clostridia bacterium]|nr:YitT family protein [Clostridia bacterium]